MGQRVVIGREPPPPLDYGKGGRAEDLWRNVNAGVQRFGEWTIMAAIAAWPYIKAW